MKVFIYSFGLDKSSINKEKALVSQWKKIEFIFQVADSEITRIQSFSIREKLTVMNTKVFYFLPFS